MQFQRIFNSTNIYHGQFYPIFGFWLKYVIRFIIFVLQLRVLVNRVHFAFIFDFILNAGGMTFPLNGSISLRSIYFYHPPS